MVRAKFTVTSKLEKPDGYEVELYPVTGGSTENAQFYRYTPGGKISMATINKAAADQLVVGKSYFVDFSEAS
jgi:hypothetical protein